MVAFALRRAHRCFLLAGSALIWERIFTREDLDSKHDTNFTVTVLLMALSTWMSLFTLIFSALGLWAMFEVAATEDLFAPEARNSTDIGLRFCA